MLERREAPPAEQPAGSLDRSEDKRAGQEADGLETAPCLRMRPCPEVHVKRQTAAVAGREGSFKRNLGETDKCHVKLYKHLLRKPVPQSPQVCEALMKTLEDDRRAAGTVYPRGQGLPRLQPCLPGTPSLPRCGSCPLPFRTTTQMSLQAWPENTGEGADGQKGRLDQKSCCQVKTGSVNQGRRPGGMPHSAVFNYSRQLGRVWIQFCHLLPSY